MIKTFILILTCLFSCVLFAQPAAQYNKRNPYAWMIGVHGVAIDDDGNDFGNLFDYENSWNYLYFPTQISLDRYIRRGWSQEWKLSYTNYSSSKVINDTTGVSGMFFSGDFHYKYAFHSFIRKKHWFNPYLAFGAGLTYRTVRDEPLNLTINAGVGANFWFSARWGLQVQSMAKFAIVSDIYETDADYLQHTAGIVYRWDSKRRRSSFNKSRYKWVHGKDRYKKHNS